MFGDDEMLKINSPSKRQLEVYDFIVDYMTEHQYAPSVREMCNGTTMKSTSTVWNHLEALKHWGLIDYQPTQPRTIKLLGYKLVKA